MIVLIILTLFSLLILLLGFLEVKIPFLSTPGAVKFKKKSVFKQPQRASEKLVKNSVENTLLKTKFLKKKIQENIYESHL